MYDNGNWRGLTTKENETSHIVFRGVLKVARPLTRRQNGTTIAKVCWRSRNEIKLFYKMNACAVFDSKNSNPENSIVSGVTCYEILS